MKEVDDIFFRRPLYCGRAGSDVIGYRRPTGGVFVCMLQITRPLGDAVRSSHEGEPTNSLSKQIRIW